MMTSTLNNGLLAQQRAMAMAGWGQQAHANQLGNYANQLAGLSHVTNSIHPTIPDKESKEMELRREYEREVKQLLPMAAVLALAYTALLASSISAVYGLFLLWQSSPRIALAIVGGTLWLGGLTYGIYRWHKRRIEVEYATKIMAAE